MDTLRRSKTPTTVVTANGEVQRNEEAQVYVQDLDLFVTVQLLEETPTVLSLGKLCSEHGCSYEWRNGETPQLTKDGKTITCTMHNFVPLSDSEGDASKVVAEKRKHNICSHFSKDRNCEGYLQKTR